MYGLSLNLFQLQLAYYLILWGLSLGHQWYCCSASVVRQLEVFLFNAARPRVTFARMSVALTDGPDELLGFGVMHRDAFVNDSLQLGHAGERASSNAFVCDSRKKRSTMLSREELMGVKCI